MLLPEEILPVIPITYGSSLLLTFIRSFRDFLTLKKKRILRIKNLSTIKQTFLNSSSGKLQRVMSFFKKLFFFICLNNLEVPNLFNFFRLNLI